MNKKFFTFILLCVFSVIFFKFDAFCEGDIDIDFESELYEIGESPAAFNGSQWVISDCGAEDSVTVEIDALSGNKALKIVNTTTNKVRFYIDIPNISSGKHWFSFDFRAENDVRYITRLGSLYSDNGWYGVIGLNSSVGYAMWDGFSNYLGSFSDGSYKNIKVFIDANNKEFQIYWNGENVPKFSGDYKSSSATDIGRIFFEVSSHSSFNGTSGDKTKPAVYWFDNIKLESYSLRVDEHSPEEQGYVDAEDVVTIKFNTPLEDASISTSDFSIEEDGRLLEENEYIVLSDDNTTVKISALNGFSYGKKYKFIVKNTIKPIDAAYKLMSEDYSFEFFVKSIIKSVTGVEDKARYSGEVNPSVMVEDGTTYEMMLSKNGGIEETLEKGTAISGKGDYVLKVIAKDAKNREETKVLSFTIVDKVVPEAREVFISGTTVATGETLKGNYTFYDINGDEPGEHIFSWYRCDTIDGEYEKITKNADGDMYTLTADDENKYIKFEIIPVSKIEPFKPDKGVKSEAFMGAFKPEVKTVKLIPSKENPDKDVELKVDAEFFDLNGDEKEAFEIKWKKSSDGINFSDITGETAETYTLKETDKNSYIKCEVIPVSKNAPFKGNKEETEIYKTFFAPEVKNVRIEGQARVGQVLAAFYEYYDENGDEHGDIRCEWIMGNKVISTASSMTLTSDYLGEEIALRVTPIAKSYPFEGEAVLSEPIIVGRSQSSGGSSGGGSSSGGSKWFSSSSYSETKEKENEQIKDGIIFIDAINHWAKDDIEKLYKKGIINGISENEFGPEINLTRAQFAAVIVRTLSLKEDGALNYADVRTEDWHNTYISKVIKAGLMQGSEGFFYPDKEITREELCVVINNILKYKNIEISGNKKNFSDENEISLWAIESIDNVSAMGIINGMEENKFLPKEKASRAQMSVILNRLLVIMGGNA